MNTTHTPASAPLYHFIKDDLHSAFCNLPVPSFSGQSAICILQFKIFNLQSALRNLKFALRIFLPIACCLLPVACCFSQTSIPGGNVYGTWTLAGSPYQIQGAIQIPNDSTLTIQPGVTVEFQGTYKLNVLGRLLAIGTVTDTIIFTAANTTNGWRGIRFDNTPATNDTSKIIYCKLQYGKATGASPENVGGAFYFYNFSMARIANCRIANCSASNSGGGIYCYNSSPTISNNAISNNTASSSGYGGGICCYNSSPTISNNTISNNTASSKGGGIYCINSSPTISNNAISNNTISSSGYGGGIYCQGSSPAISNNTISNNTASYDGGGIYCFANSSPAISNNTVSNNSAINGGALYCENNSDPILRNSILWGNTASTAGPQVFLYDETSDPNFYYCDVQGGTASFELNGNFYTGAYQNNINADPLFVAPSGGSGTGFNGVTADWSLQVSSPCIDTGDPATITPATDIIGNPRVVVCRVDMGAYEYQSGIPFSITITQTQQILCNGDSSAAVQAMATGGSLPYIFLWNTGDTTDTANNLAIGTYSVTVGNASGCSRSDSITITQPSGMSLSTSQTDINCNGQCTGSATVYTSGGTSPYSYLWSSSLADTNATTPSALCTGPYTVTVTDNQGCTQTTGVNIVTPTALSFTVSQINISCNGGNNGSITVNASGGTGTIQYSKDGGFNYYLSNIFTGLLRGTLNSIIFKLYILYCSENYFDVLLFNVPHNNCRNI